MSVVEVKEDVLAEAMLNIEHSTGELLHVDGIARVPGYQKRRHRVGILYAIAED